MCINLFAHQFINQMRVFWLAIETLLAFGTALLGGYESLMAMCVCLRF